MARGVGSIRRSQLVTSFGPGATIDLPEDSVIIGGLDWWPTWRMERIIEPRLEEAAARVLGVDRLELKSPPIDDDAPGAPPVGVKVERFPLWFVAEHVVRERQGRKRPLVPKGSLDRGKYQVPQGRKVPVTPVRFVQACVNGHIADIEWYPFVHGGPSACRRPLWLVEYGTSGDLTDQEVLCECGARRALAQATRRETLGMCKGQRPWLPQGELCGGEAGPRQMMRLLIRTASNAYYPQKLSVLSLPEGSDRLRAAVESVRQSVEGVHSAEDLQQLRRLIPAVRDAFEGFGDREVLEHVVAVREGRRPTRRPIKLEEFDALANAQVSFGEDRPEGHYYARRLELPEPRPSVLEPIERVVLVHRLREVTCQVGFTRFEPVVPDLQGELDLQVRRADLATEATWLPAMESRGEGIFLLFKEGPLQAWWDRPEVRSRERQFLHAPRHGEQLPLNLDVRYMLLHSLSHLLIAALSLDCGYNASSLRERIYVTPNGCGLLIYTGTTDAEGTLGGLVAAGRNIERYMRMALDIGRLCSNDPVCAQHAPDQPLEGAYTLGAACHGCLLIAETSCERRNELLDRSLVVPTVEQNGCEFFR